eukprot:365554-Chlamydomonas_euryale.AAC.24
MQAARRRHPSTVLGIYVDGQQQGRLSTLQGGVEAWAGDAPAAHAGKRLAYACAMRKLSPWRQGASSSLVLHYRRP